MSTRKRKPPAKATEPPAQPPFDVAAHDALTDDDIAAQIAANPDAAPLQEWSLDDPRVRVIEPIDVKAIRARLGMSQSEFAAAFGLSVASVQEWEQQRRAPRGPSLTLLRIIDREPDAARRALSLSTDRVADRRALRREARRAATSPQVERRAGPARGKRMAEKPADAGQPRPTRQRS